MSQHTPGPWHRNIPPASKYCVIFAGRNTHVAQVVRGIPEEQIEGNADLIAAAPELLAALEQYADQWGETAAATAVLRKLGRRP